MTPTNRASLATMGRPAYKITFLPWTGSWAVFDANLSQGRLELLDPGKVLFTSPSSSDCDGWIDAARADTLTLGRLLAAVTQIPDWTCPGCGKTYADPADVPTTCPECGEYADTDVDTLTLGTLIALAEAAWGDGR